MALAFGWFVFAIACGFLADKRGRSSVGWFFIALIFSPLIAGVFLLVLPEGDKPNTLMRRCSACRELIRRDAVLCKHCGTRDPFAEA